MKHASAPRSADTLFDVAVVGGGPAGMLAAIRAAERGRRVVLIEKNPILGKKLLITGGGRCNVTNHILDTRTLLARYGQAKDFLYSAFAQHSVADSIQFFKEQGVELKVENEGRMFPTTDSSRTILDALVKPLEKLNVTICAASPVAGIEKRKDGIFHIALAHGETIAALRVVLATGGTSHPETGSTGEGFAWLRSLGHTIHENDFALVPVALRDAWAKTLGGVTLPAIKLTLRADDKRVLTKTGKLLFTHFGISGPTVLNMSKKVGEYLEHSNVTIELDLFPDLDHGTLRNRLNDLLAVESNKMLKNTLRTLVPAALVAPLLALIKVDGDTKNHSVRKEDRSALVTLLKAVTLHVSGLLGADRAIISAGGVSLTEVDFRTMESRIVSGLYLIGDVLDIDRPSGGYSLQLCWTTGHVAGMHA